MDCILCSHCCSVPVTAAPRPPVVSLQRSVGQQQSEGALGAAVCVTERAGRAALPEGAPRHSAVTARSGTQTAEHHPLPAAFDTAPTDLAAAVQLIRSILSPGTYFWTQGSLLLSAVLPVSVSLTRVSLLKQNPSVPKT